jgi:hypothetical protein
MTPDTQANWPHPDNNPPRDLARKGELVARVRVDNVVFEVGSAISTVLAEDITGCFTAEWKTKPAPAVGDEFDIWRMGAGQVYAVGATGDRHQLSSMTSSTENRAGEPPFPPADADLIQAATREARSLGLRLEFRRTSVVVGTPRGDIEQHFLGDWRNTLREAGLPVAFPPR